MTKPPRRLSWLKIESRLNLYTSIPSVRQDVAQVASKDINRLKISNQKVRKSTSIYIIIYVPVVSNCIKPDLTRLVLQLSAYVI